MVRPPGIFRKRRPMRQSNAIRSNARAISGACRSIPRAAARSCNACPTRNVELSSGCQTRWCARWVESTGCCRRKAEFRSGRGDAKTAETAAPASAKGRASTGETAQPMRGCRDRAMRSDYQKKSAPACRTAALRLTRMEKKQGEGFGAGRGRSTARQRRTTAPERRSTSAARQYGAQPPPGVRPLLFARRCGTSEERSCCARRAAAMFARCAGGVAPAVGASFNAWRRRPASIL